jgi:hypothetical protein
MEKMTATTAVTEMGETIEETAVAETEETAKTEMEETAKMEMAVEKVTEKTAAENIMEEMVTAIEETEMAMEEMDTETVKRTEEKGNIADSYQNHRNTHQMDGETILYML